MISGSRRRLDINPKLQGQKDMQWHTDPGILYRAKHAHLRGMHYRMPRWV